MIHFKWHGTMKRYSYAVYAFNIAIQTHRKNIELVGYSVTFVYYYAGFCFSLTKCHKYSNFLNKKQNENCVYTLYLCIYIYCTKKLSFYIRSWFKMNVLFSKQKVEETKFYKCSHSENYEIFIFFSCFILDIIWIQHCKYTS